MAFNTTLYISQRCLNELKSQSLHTGGGNNKTKYEKLIVTGKMRVNEKQYADDDNKDKKQQQLNQTITKTKTTDTVTMK